MIEKIKKFLEDKRNEIVSTEEAKKKLITKGVIALIVIFFIIFLSMSLIQPKHPKTTGEARKEGIESPFKETEISQQQWILQAGGRLDGLEKTTSELQEQINKLADENKKLSEEIKTLKKDIKKQLIQIEKAVNSPIPSLPHTNTGSGTGETDKDIYIPKSKREDIKIIKPEVKHDSNDSLPITLTTEKTLIPAGSIARGVLLTGVYATKGNEYPVLIEILTPFYETNLNIYPKVIHSFTVAKATGDVSSGRVYIRLEKIALELEDTIITLPARGWITGIDGSYGIQGKVERHEGKFVALALASSFSEGVSEGIRESGIERTTTPYGGIQETVEKEEIAKVATATGASKTAGTLSGYFLKRANEIQPVVYVPPGQIVDIILYSDLKEGGEG